MSQLTFEATIIIDTDRGDAPIGFFPVIDGKTDAATVGEICRDKGIGFYNSTLSNDFHPTLLITDITKAAPVEAQLAQAVLKLND